MFPGDPVAGEYWSWTNADSAGGGLSAVDVRVIGSFGPLDLAPDDTVSFTLALVWSRGSDYLDSVSKLKVDAAYIRSNWQYATTPRGVGIDAGVSDDAVLATVYPNPARDRAWLVHHLDNQSHVKITVRDLLGRQVAVVADTFRAAGEHTVTIPAERWPPGLYFLTLATDRATQTVELVVL